MGSAGHSDSHDPNEQGRNTGEGYDVERAEKLEHEFSRICAAKPLAPFIPALADKCVQKLLAGICLQDNFGGCRNIRSHSICSTRVKT